MCLWGPVCFPIAEFIELGRNGKGLEATHRSELKHEPHGASPLLNAAVSPRCPCGVTLIPHLNSPWSAYGTGPFHTQWRMGTEGLEVSLGSGVYHRQI